MSSFRIRIEERAARIGSFLVGRLLPFREKRSVGPFVFMDHMGPVKLGDRENVDILPHPHIGLSTLTYLFEGSILHRDSLGTEMEIHPGAVNWMTAGRGIVHSERTPEHLRHSEKLLHGLQIWVALPRHLEQMEPSFVHIPESRIPAWTEENGLSFRLVAGEALGRTSPVPVYSPLYLLEIKSDRRSAVDLNGKLFGETGLYILQGAVYADGERHGPGHILVAADSGICAFELEEHSVIYLFGGEPFPEERYIDWNFVSSEKSLIEKARHDWARQLFPKIPGESGFVPYPERK